MAELTITLARLRRLMGVSRVTLWRGLRKRRASYTGHSITFAELHRVWPELLAAIQARALRESSLVCPHCTGELHLSCTCCGRDIPLPRAR